MPTTVNIAFVLPPTLKGDQKNWYGDFKSAFDSIFEQVKGEVEFTFEEVVDVTGYNASDKLLVLFHLAGYELDYSMYSGIMESSLYNINILFDIENVDDLDPFTEGATSFSFGLFDIENDNFFPKIVDVSYGILNNLEGKSKSPILGAPTVFLAEVRPEQEYLRDALKRELLSHGYTVYPNRPIPNSKEELEKDLKEYLGKSHLAIHVINENYEEEDKTKVELQNEFCKYYRMTVKSSLDRLIWAPPQDEFDEKQLVFIERLKRHSKALDDAELIQTPLERFKNIVKNRVTKLMFQRRIPEGYSDILESDKKKVYVINNVEDQEKVKEVEGLFAQSDLVAIPTFFKGDEIELLDLHRYFLASCDAAFIYHNGKNYSWLKMKMLDLLKAPGYGRNRPISVKGLYVSNDNLQLPKIENLDDLLVIRKGEIDQKDLKSFVEKI